MKKLTITCVLSLFFLATPLVAAEATESELELLREQVRLLTARLDKLEQAAGSQAAPAASPAQAATTELAATPAAAGDDEALDRKIEEAVDARVAEKMAAVSWAERMRWSGDFRYRYENINPEGQDERNRNRIRARVNLMADISDTMKIGFGLATGSEDPVSANQTLGGGGSSKPINLDLAYFEWTGLKNTKIIGGKFKQQHVNVGDSGLLWDSDWRPEGTSIKYDNGMLYALALGTWIESDSNKSQQEFSYGLQAGINFPLGERMGLNVGAGYYQFDSQGKRSFFGDGDFFGNSFDPITSTYLHDYIEVEGFAELSFDLFDRPTLLYADYVQNLEVDENDKAYALGINYNQAKKQGTWEMSYVYKRLEADAVLGLLADSNFGGGGTNAKGSVISGTYAVHDNWNFKMTYFINQTGIDESETSDYNRLQLDLKFSYK